MTGKEWSISDEDFTEIMRNEFGIIISYENPRELMKAREALFFYNTIWDFLEQSRWRYDNPELSDEQYLTKNRICRWIDGRLAYFSRLKWGEGK